MWLIDLDEVELVFVWLALYPFAILPSLTQPTQPALSWLGHDFISAK
jgi:hypothetical protein